MSYSYPITQKSQTLSLAKEQDRRRLVTAVISFTQGTSIVASPYERQLLDQFISGHLTIDEVVYYLESTALNGVRPS